MSVLPTIQAAADGSTVPELVYQAVEGGVTEHVVRYRVPGGWCYRTIVAIDGRQAGPAASVCFVPDPSQTAIRGNPNRQEVSRVIEKKLAKARSRGRRNAT